MDKERNLLEAMGPINVRRTSGHSFCATLQNGTVEEMGRVNTASAAGSTAPVAVCRLFNDLTGLRASQKLTVNNREYRWNGSAFTPA